MGPAEKFSVSAPAARNAENESRDPRRRRRACLTVQTSQPQQKDQLPVPEEQPAAPWPDDLLPFVDLLKKAGVQCPQELAIKVPSSLVISYLKLLAQKFPESLADSWTVWRLRRAVEALHASAKTGPQNGQTPPLSEKFPCELVRPYVSILEGTGVPDAVALLAGTPYASIEAFVDHIRDWDGTRHLVPDITTHFALVHALRAMYEEAGHGQAT